MLTPKGYRNRVIDAQIDLSMKAFGAVAIEGPKWCGKTWTTLNHADSVVFLGDPAQSYQNRELAMLDPASVLIGAEPRAIDEWQEVPGIWDAVRHEVDKLQKTGRFILTGSSTPLHGTTLHSGIGRIQRLRMRSMTLQESGESNGAISLRSLLAGESPKSSASADLSDLAWFAARGGWPNSLHLSREASALIPGSYYQALVHGDIQSLEGSPSNIIRLERVLRSLARNNQTPVGATTIALDIRNADESEETYIAPSTVTSYLRLLERLYVIEYLPAWDPNIRSTSRVRKTPIVRFTDPSLAMAAMNLSEQHALSDLRTFGLLFESLCARDMAVYTEALGHRLYYYKDDTVDTDFIVEMKDGQWGAFEVKLGANQVEEAAKKLLRLKNKLIKSGASEPVCLVVLCGISKYGYRRPDGVSVVPITNLGV